MKRTLVVMLVVTIFFVSMSTGCATGPGIGQRDLLQEAIQAVDRWWLSVTNEDPHYYNEIDLGKVIVHLCGSRAKLWVEYNVRYPHAPMNLIDSDAYMFTCSPDRRFAGAPAHVWMVVKVRGGKVLLHKWAAGHELVRTLSCFDGALENASEY